MDQAEHAGRMEDAGLVRQARQGLIDAAGSQDAAAKNAAQARAIAAGVLKPEAPDRYTVVPGGQEWIDAANAMRNVPGRVFNNQTGQFVEDGWGRPASNPKQAEGTLLKGKDGRTYKVVNGVPEPV